MKKFFILLLCLLTLFVGFLFYKQIDKGIEAYTYKHEQDIDYTQIKKLPVDEHNAFETYTHQRTTYPIFDSNVLKSTIHYVNTKHVKGILIAHINDKTFIVDSFEILDKKATTIENIHGTFVLLWPKDITLQYGLQGEIYETDSHYYMSVQAHQLGQVVYEFDDFTLELQIKDL